MKINGWHIDGFGIFANERVEQINPGLTVFEGCNGAGKSTLFAFIQAMLFGPPARGKAKYEPLRGGQHGGTIYLTGPEDHQYAVHRQLNRGGDVNLTRNAEPFDHTHLGQLLGHCDKTMFQAVFAFGLSELQELDALNNEETKGRLALAGLTGAGTSPQAVLKKIEAQTSGLLKQRNGKATINDLRTEMQTINTELENARQASAQYDAHRNAEETATQSRDRISEELSQLASARAQYQQLIDVWPSWFQYDNAERERQALVLDDGIASVADEVERLRNETEQYEQWHRQRDEWKGKQRAAETIVDAQVRDLGCGWNRERLIAIDRSIPRKEEIRGFEERIDETTETAKRAAESVSLARGQAARAKDVYERRVAECDEAGEPISQESLDQQRSTVNRLRGALANAATLAFQVQTDEDRVAEMERARAAEASKASTWNSPWVPPVIWLSALALLGLAVWSLVAARTIVATVAFAAAIVLAVAGLYVSRRNTSAFVLSADHPLQQNLTRASQRLASNRTQLAELRQSIASQATIIGAPAIPIQHDLDDAEDRLRTRDDHRRTVLALQKDLNEALTRLDEASAELASAEQLHREAVTAANAAQEAWAAWQAAAGVPAHLSPEGTIDFLATTEEGRRQAQLATEAHDGAQRLEALITGFERRLGQIAAQLGQPLPKPGNGAVMAVDDLFSRLEQDRLVRQNWKSLQQKAITAITSVDESLGSGPRADDSRELLRTGTKDSWEEQIRDIDVQMASLRSQRDGAIQEAQKARSERQGLEESADIARLELELAGLKTEAADAIREWAVLTLAEGLITTTLQKFERERQPAVFQHASGLFENVTDGRYLSVSRSLEDTVQITTDNGQSMAPHHLSRGTMEQLYLCLRLGLADSLSEQTGRLPLIMDDVLVNFDPERAREVAKVLFEVASTHQVLLFTCHPETVSMLQHVNGGCGHYKMGDYGEVGHWQPSA